MAHKVCSVTLKNWAPKQITEELEKKLMDRLEKAGEGIAHTARYLVMEEHRGVSRPVYKKGKDAGAAWTARVPGTVRDSIRVTRLKGDPKLDIRIYAGARQTDKLTAYYAHILEYGSKRMKKQPFLRPALDMNKGLVMQVLEQA
jgi:HK97 gp10 family phage protein